MATFTNQATLSYNGNVTNSNVVVGEIVETLSATKTAISGSYRANDIVTYAVSITNTGDTPATGITVNDDLGAYEAANGVTRVPLTYVNDSARYYSNGTPQNALPATTEPSLAISGITVPAGGNVLVVYQARANEFAEPGVGGTINNTATITGDGIAEPITATASITAESEPNLTITKSLSPETVSENGQLTYTFVIQNTGNTAATEADTVSVTDTFNPGLDNISVTLDGNTLAPTTDYTYDTAANVFTTVPGRINVPAATYTQDETTGAWVMTPGISTLQVTGTV